VKGCSALPNTSNPPLQSGYCTVQSTNLISQNKTATNPLEGLMASFENLSFGYFISVRRQLIA
jgi:hypothetical protein